MNIKGHLGTSALILPFFIVGISEISPIINNIMNIKESVLVFDTFSYFSFFLFVIFYYMGERTPDLDLKFKVFYQNGMPHYKYHRQFTHSIILWLMLLLYGFTNINYGVFIIAYALGGISHLVGDIFTGSIPIFLWGDYRKMYRFGITSFLPKFLHKVFTVSFPRFMDKIWKPSFFVGILLFVNLFVGFVEFWN